MDNSLGAGHTKDLKVFARFTRQLRLKVNKIHPQATNTNSLTNSQQNYRPSVKTAAAN